MSRRIRAGIATAALGVAGMLSAGSASAAAEILLPGTTVDGVTVAVQFDDFLSYSNQLLIEIQNTSPTILPESTFGDFSFATGTGGLDVILYTGAGTNNRNQNVAGNSALDFEDPVSAPAGGATSLDGWWGQDDQDNDGIADGVNGPVTVGDILDYLHFLNPDNSIPVFYMDLNQIGSEASLLFSARVTLLNPDGSIFHEWSLDTLLQPGDGTFDIDQQALAAGEIDAVVGTSGAVYGPVNHNLGSGQADFIAFAPTMNLSLFDPTLRFVVEFHMDGLNDGFEEIFLTGRIAVVPPPPNGVPEPGTLALLGLGLGGLAFLRRRRAVAA